MMGEALQTSIRGRDTLNVECCITDTQFVPSTVRGTH